MEGSLEPSHLGCPFLVQESLAFVPGFLPLFAAWFLPPRPSPVLPPGHSQPFPNLTRGAQMLTLPPVLGIENLTLTGGRIS